MPAKTFTSGRIRKVDWDPESRQLDILWDNKSVLAYKQVPQEVFRRLCAAPNPAAYWEDRIAEEYPAGRPRRAGTGDAAGNAFDDLFGGREKD